MNETSYVAFFALIVVVVLYALDRWPIAPLGFTAVAMTMDVSESFLGHWLLASAALVASRRRFMRRGRDDHV